MPSWVLVSLTVASISQIFERRKVTLPHRAVNQAQRQSGPAISSDPGAGGSLLTPANRPCDTLRPFARRSRSTLMPDEKKQSHTLADHLLGQDFVHEHDGDADHDHDHFDFDPEERIEDNPIWIQDHVTLVTVGIDIGSVSPRVIMFPSRTPTIRH